MTGFQRRLGLRQLWRDHVDTWSTAETAQERGRDRRRSALWYFGLPTLSMLPTFIWHVRLHQVGQLIAGVSTFAGLMFALLAGVFAATVAIRADRDKFDSTTNLRLVITHLRSNITYAILVTGVLDAVLIAASSSTEEIKRLNWAWTPPLVWLLVHLGLTTFTLLNRFRAAFNNITW